MSRSLSIIIPVYNADSYLRECLDSLLIQSLMDIEIVAVNDGSTDGSLTILEEYARADERIKIVNQNNAGVGAARNAGVANARCSHVMFVDADDYILGADSLSKIYKATKSGTGMVMYNIQYESKRMDYPFKSGIYTGRRLEEFLAFFIKNEHINSPCNKIYNKQILQEHKIKFDDTIKIGEDLLFNIEYLRHVRVVNYLNDDMYFYRTSNQNSATSRFLDNKYSELMYVNNRLKAWVEDSGFSYILYDVVLYIRLKNILSCIRDLTMKQNSLSSTEKSDRLMRYKRENRWIIVKWCGILPFLASIIYSFFDIRITQQLISRIRQ